MGVIKKSRRHSGRECRNPEARDDDTEPENCACCEEFNYSSERYLNCYATSVLPHPCDLDSGIPCRNDVASFNLTELPKGKGIVTAFPLPLHALTAAALVLPGLLQNTAYAAEDDSVDFQYSHYQEGKRDIYGLVLDPNTQKLNSSKIPQNLNPIEVDSLHGSSRISLTDRVKFAFNYTQDTWSGATPVGAAPALVGANHPQSPGNDTTTGIVTGASPYARSFLMPFFMDKKGNIFSVNFDPNTGLQLPGSNENQLTHVLSSASPETRKQGDFTLGYEWNEAAVSVGGGISIENDYESRFVNLGGRMDFNQKQTTVNLGLSYTNSDTHATLDPDALQFINTQDYDNSFSEFVDIDPLTGNDIYKISSKMPIASAGEIDSTYNQSIENKPRTSAIMRGNRQDFGTQLGLTHVINKNAVLKLGLAYTRSTGYMANPYKLVYAFESQLLARQDPNQPYLFSLGQARLEIRPNERNQFNWNLGYKQYIELFDAAFHFDYNFAHDDWGINAHTFEADWAQPVGSGWIVTPRVRYYSQSSADFYAPFFTTVEVIDPTTSLIVDSPYNRELPKFYSSDQRLSGFGTLSGGVTIAKQFAKGVQLETGFEYYTHQGGLKLGGGGEQDFANFDYWVANAALKVNLDAIRFKGAGSGFLDSHEHHHHSASPAGVMFDHTLKQSGDFMVGYRYMRSEQAGDMLLGSQTVSLDNVKLNGCGDQECSVSPKQMNMNMHMLDLMYAPSNWLTLMLMPQWVDMDMTMNPLGDETKGGGHNHGGSVHAHQTGGIGDTGMYALFKLFDQSGHHINLSLGGTAPTGDVDVKLRKTATNPYPTFIHYGMQLGSGTWDFKPSLTYTGAMDGVSWGAQVTGTKRLESRNKSGFALGDIFQGSVWSGFHWTNWLSTTVRGVYTSQGRIHGAYPPTLVEKTDPITGLPALVPYVSQHVGPFDQPGNYGGQFVDLGLGLNVNIPSGTFAGNSLKFEWLQPLHTDYNGYQLDRDGALSFSWGYGF